MSKTIRRPRIVVHIKDRGPNGCIRRERFRNIRTKEEAGSALLAPRSCGIEPHLASIEADYPLYRSHPSSPIVNTEHRRLPVRNIHRNASLYGIYTPVVGSDGLQSNASDHRDIHHAVYLVALCESPEAAPACKADNRPAAQRKDYQALV